MLQYKGVNFRPDICVPVQLLAPGILSATKIDQKALKKAINFMIETKYRGLNYINQYFPSSKLVFLSDVSFSNSIGLKNQLGFIILLIDKYEN